jgi:hypothetical protein
MSRENAGLREANATLSAKLFEEMERTDACLLPQTCLTREHRDKEVTT